MVLAKGSGVTAKQSGNELEVNLEKKVTHQKLSQSEDLRGWALKYLDQRELIIRCVWTTLVCWSLSYSLLNIAWLAIVVEPAFHTVVRWSLFYSPILLAIVFFGGWIGYFKKAHQWTPSLVLLAASAGFWLTWYMHSEVAR